MTDARTHLQSLVGQEIRTLTNGRVNRIIRVDNDHVIVGTAKSPGGQPVPVEWVQEAIDRLEHGEDIEVTVEGLGHRGAFIGAVLATLPGVRVQPTTPRRLTRSRRSP